MRLESTDDGNRSSSPDDDDDDGRIPAHQMEVLIAHLFEKYDTSAYRLNTTTATDAPSASSSSSSSGDSSRSGGTELVSQIASSSPHLLPPHARFLVAPGGLTRRPTGLECFEMADCADPKGTGRMGVRGFLAGVRQRIEKCSAEGGSGVLNLHWKERLFCCCCCFRSCDHLIIRSIVSPNT